MLFSLEFKEDNPLFGVAFHPSAAEFIVGLADGTVSGYEYSGAEYKQVWTTKRHEGSCRAVAYTEDGKLAASAGSEGIIKLFDAKNGKVVKKAKFSKTAGATVICINEEYILVGDDEGQVTVYQLDLTKHRKYKLDEVDSISCIKPLYCFNKHNFVIGCDSYVIRIDVRKDEPVVQSEDQEDEVLCGCVVSDSLSCFGMSEGVVTIWKNKGLTDQQQRIKLIKDGSVDSLLTGESMNTAFAALSNGEVAHIDVNSAKVLFKVPHGGDDCLYLDFDYEYRLVTGSMSLLNVWNINEPDEVAEKAELESQAAKEREEKQQAASKKRSKNKKGGNKKKMETNDMFADLL